MSPTEQIKVNQRAFDAVFVNCNSGLESYCDEIVASANKIGLEMTRYQAQKVWERYCGVRDAQWLDIGGDDQLHEAISEFIGAGIEAIFHPK